MSPSPTPGGERAPDGGRPEPPQNIAAAIADVSERASQLVREEIELAKAEVTVKVTELLRGAVVGVAAGIFIVTALFFFLIGCAWLLYYYLPGNNFTYFIGFFAMALILVLLGAMSGMLAAKVVKRSSPPVPTMAIDEARKIRDVMSAHDGAGAGYRVPASASGAGVPSSPPVSAPPEPPEPPRAPPEPSEPTA